ncbi:MAG: alpha/beta fold hydrolase [Phycisphaerales bacterium]|nr:alpha/beta fold hydrolase [Phycisphaerales bacterium]
MNTRFPCETRKITLVARGSVLAIFATSLLPATVWAGTDDDAGRVKIAQAFAQRLAKGKFDEATERFDETMKKVLPEEKLRQLWTSLSGQSGGFKSFGEPTTAKVGAHDVVYIPAEFGSTDLSLKVVFDHKNRITGFFVEPAREAAITPTYQPPGYDRQNRYTEKDVEFGEERWRVKGKLTIPNTRNLAPAVVLVHGSGPHDEDETIGPNKPFRDLAAGLSSNGIAVLRYQKRTHAHQLKLVAKKTITVHEEVIDDALAALAFLREEAPVNKGRIYLLGHSLGATLAPQIAYEDKKLAGVIMLAGTPRDFCEVIEEQLAYISSLPGPNQAANKKIYEDSRDIIARYRAGKLGSDAVLLGPPVSYWNEISEYGRKSLDVAKQLKCRMLIVNGGRDYQVTKKDYDLYRGALKDQEHVTFKWHEDLNHLFMTGKGKATPAEYAKAGHVDSAVIDRLVMWIKSK